MPTDFNKAKQEQETRRKLWRQQQQARMQARLPEDLSTNGPKEKQQENSAKDSQGSPTGRSFNAITARLKKQKLKESKKDKGKQGIKGKIEEVKKKKKEIEEAAKALKNIYRIINGTAAVSLVGLIITFLVMNAQFIFGNLLKLKVIPELSKVETFLVLFIDFVIFMLLIILIWLICLIVAISAQHPVVKILI